MRYLSTLLLLTTTILITAYAYGADPEGSEGDVITTTKVEVSTHLNVALDPSADVQDRINSAQQLPEGQAIQAYDDIICSINTNRTLSVDAKLSYLIEAEVGRYKAKKSERMLLLLHEHVDDLFEYTTAQTTTYVNWQVVISATEILFEAKQIDESDALSWLNLAVNRDQGTSLPNTVLLAAETAGRLKFLDDCKKYLKLLARFTADEELNQKAARLHARLFPNEASFSKALKDGIGQYNKRQHKQGIATLFSQFQWFLDCNPSKQHDLLVDTHSMITAVELLFNNRNFNLESAAAVIRWAVDHTYNFLTNKEETIIYAAETTARIGDHEGAKAILEYRLYPYYQNGTTDEFKARVQTLKTALAITQ